MSKQQYNFQSFIKIVGSDDGYTLKPGFWLLTLGV